MTEVSARRAFSGSPFKAWRDRVSRRDFDKLVEQRPPTRFYIILGMIAVAAILLAIFAIDW